MSCRGSFGLALTRTRIRCAAHVRTAGGILSGCPLVVNNAVYAIYDLLTNIGRKRLVKKYHNSWGAIICRFHLAIYIYIYIYEIDWLIDEYIYIYIYMNLIDWFMYIYIYIYMHEFDWLIEHIYIYIYMNFNWLIDEYIYMNFNRLIDGYIYIYEIDWLIDEYMRGLPGRM